MSRKALKVVSVIVLVIIIVTIIYLNKSTEIRYSEEVSPIPLSEDKNYLALYRYYRDKERYPTEDYAAYVLDPCDDEYLTTLCKNLTSMRYDVFAILEYVRDIPFVHDVGEYPRFPIETIVDNCGDCEDKAILCASLLTIAGYETVLVRLPNHMMVGIYEDENLTYYETTASVWNDDIPDNVTLHSIDNRAILFHEWKNVTIRYNVFGKEYLGEITVSNVGTATANATLDIIGNEKTFSIEPFHVMTVTFLYKEDIASFYTKLYSDGEFVEEKYEQ